MKMLLLTTVLLLGALTSPAQVRWSLTTNLPAGAPSGTKGTAVLTAEIEEDWHISSLSQPEGGPLRTEISLPDKQPVKLADKIVAPPPHKKRNAAFDMIVETYAGVVVFTLPLAVVEPIKPGTRLKVEVTYQACTEETCLLPRTETVEVLIPAEIKKARMTDAAVGSWK